MQKIHIAGSTKPVQVYSLDAVISAGYRVNSKAATKFRQWATGTIKAFIEQGYVINDRALHDIKKMLDDLGDAAPRFGGSYLDASSFGRIYRDAPKP